MPRSRLPGLAYLTWLREWWSDPRNEDFYPGSAVTALRWLQRQRPPDSFSLRVTEKDEATCQRLRQALGAFKSSARQASFMDELDWLTGEDDLLLLVDPFGCVDKFDAASGPGLDDGWIDHDVVRDILRRCAGKERAVLSFWWGHGRDRRLAASHNITCNRLAGWSQRQRRAVCRVFHDAKNHANALIGVGAGAEIVSSLPGREKWRASWLADAVYENA